MAKITIPCLVPKKTAGGTRYYWQPSATLKRAGWTALSLGMDEGRAIDAARARNEEVAAWRNGSAPGAAVKPPVERATMGKLIEDYREKVLPKRAKATQHEYESCLRYIRKWAQDGRTPLRSIDRQRVLVLRDALDKWGKPARAASILRVLRIVMQYGLDQGMIASNPVSRINIAAPAARQRIATEEEMQAWMAGALRLGRPSIALAILMGYGFGQREGDLLRATWASWRDGRLRVQQSKTGAIVDVKAFADLRAALNAAWRANKDLAVPRANILINEETGKPWNSRVFQRQLDAARAEAIAPGKPGAFPNQPRIPDPSIAPCESLATLQFRDLRRTAVVRLAEIDGNDLHNIAAVTGHQIETTKRILEVYLPRNRKMSDAAIDRLDAARAAKAAAADQEQQA